MTTKRQVTITRVAEGGVAYIDDPQLDQLMGFDFGKIVGYKGESARKLGLRPGIKVTVEYDDSKIKSVELLSK